MIYVKHEKIKIKNVICSCEGGFRRKNLLAGIFRNGHTCPNTLSCTIYNISFAKF
jgi:hypothetical protein